MTYTYLLFEYPVSPSLAEEIKTIPLSPIKEGSGHSGIGYEAGWIGDLHNTRLSLAPLEDGLPHVFKAVDALGSWLDDWAIDQVMVNRLGPRSALDQHRDADRGVYRFHLPVITTPDVFWWDEIIRTSVHFELGNWYGPVPYANVLHSMHNDSSQARYHIVADMKPPHKEG